MSVRKADRWGLVACYLLALACLVAAVYNLQMLVPLLNNGRHADAVVVAVDRGVKGAMNAVFQFVTETGTEVVAQDRLDMYFVRMETGEQVTVIYDPSDPTVVTADLGVWVWQGPAVFLLGFILLVFLGWLLPQMKKNE